MSGVDLSPEAVSWRLRRQSQESDLRRGSRAYKVDMSREGVTRRLRLQSSLRTACLSWGRLGAGAPPISPPRP